MIIFGAKSRITKSNVNDVLKQACPECGDDLVLSDLKKWFTLYFIPIFPYETVQTIYHCKKCGSSYKENFKNALQSSKKSVETLKKQAKKMYATTLVACMTHMAGVDGNISKEEQHEIDNLATNFPEFKKDITETIKSVKKAKTDDVVFAMLKQASSILTSVGIMTIIGQAGKVLLADGKISKEEEKLMKEYLLVCGIPRDLYSDIIDKLKKQK